MDWSFGGIAFAVGVVYALGAGVTYVLNRKMGNITPPLIIMRCLVWPYWMITGKPDGASMGPD
jgi:hypothetical protein